jgi:hypothetical protein
VTVTSPEHPLYGTRLEVLQLVSDRGPRWITVRVPSGIQRNLLRTATDLAQALPDSKSTPLVSGAILLRVVRRTEALLLHLEEEGCDDEGEIEGYAVECASRLVPTACADATQVGDADRTSVVPETRRPRR